LIKIFNPPGGELMSRVFHFVWRNRCSVTFAIVAMLLESLTTNARADEPKKYKYTATARLRASDGVEEPMPKLPGRVTASSIEEAKTKASADARKIIGELYPRHSLVADSLTVQLEDMGNDVPAHQADGPKPLRARIRVTLTTENYKEIKKNDGVTVFGRPIGVGESAPDITDTFRSTLEMTTGATIRSFDGELKTFGRGDVNNWFLSFLIWDDEVSSVEGLPQDFKLKVTQAPGTTSSDVGDFTIRLKVDKRRIKVDWLPTRFATVERQEVLGPVSWARVSLSGGGNRYAAIAYVIDESNLKTDNARIVAIKNKKSGYPIEIRPSEYNTLLDRNPGTFWTPGDNAQAQQGPNRPRGFVCQEWLMLPEMIRGETAYRFHNLSSMKALGVDCTASEKPGAKVSQWICRDGQHHDHFLFRLVPAGGDWYKLLCMEGGQYLDFNFFAINDVSGGCLAAAWGENADSAHQTWKFEDR
jgi:hypothetical protein